MEEPDEIRTPSKNHEKFSKLVVENAKKSHSKKIVKKAKLSLIKQTCAAKTLFNDVNKLNETEEFQDNQLITNLRVKPILKTKRNVVKPQKSMKLIQSNNDRENREGTDSREIIHRNVAEASDVETDDGSKQTCPSCQQSITSSQNKIHILQCLKEQFALVKNKPGSQDVTEREEYHLCQICQKNITHMTSTRRSQHVNKCMDESDKAKKDEERKKKLLLDAKTAIMDCPICGKSLKTAQSRKNHMKKCAVANHITTDRLLALTKQQEEDRQLEITAGVLPSAIRGLKVKSNPPPVDPGKKARSGLPKTKLDEETQLALALSSSIADQQRIQQQAITGDKNPGKKSRNKKNCTEDIPLILQLSKEEAKLRLANRITKLLISTPQNSQEVTVTPSSESKLHPTDCSVDCDIFKSTSCQPRLWTGAGLTETESEIEKFYVASLMPTVTISTIKAGNKLKRMSAIPGRRSSEELQREIALKQHTATMLPCQPETDESSATNHPSSSPPITQTAAILAEMAADADASCSHLENSVLQPANDLHCSGFCPEEPLVIPDHIKGSTLTSLQASFLSLVNSAEDSDITILTKNDQLYAHKVFLRSRCPKLFEKLSCDGEYIDLSDTSGEAILSVLKYVYAGVVCLYPGSIQHVLDITSRYGLKVLETLCKTVISSSTDQQDKNTEDHGLVVLDKLWSDSESEEDVKGHSDGGEIKGQEDVEEEDWREMFYTQRERLRKQLSNESEESSCDSLTKLLSPLDDKCSEKSASDVDSDDDKSIMNIINEKRRNSILSQSGSLEDKLTSLSTSSHGEIEILSVESGEDVELQEKCKKAISEETKDIEICVIDPKQSDNSSSVTFSHEDSVAETDRINSKLRILPDSTTNDLFQSDEELFSDDEPYSKRNSQSFERLQNRQQDKSLSKGRNSQVDIGRACDSNDSGKGNLGKIYDEEDQLRENEKHMSDHFRNPEKDHDAITMENSIENPIYLSSDSDTEVSQTSSALQKDTDIDICSEEKNYTVVWKESQVLKSNNKILIEEKDVISLDNKLAAEPIMDINTLSDNSDVKNTNCDNCEGTSDKKDLKKFKFVNIKNKDMRTNQTEPPPPREATAVSSVMLKTGYSDKDTKETLNACDNLHPNKRKLDCVLSPKFKSISRTPHSDNKRYKVSTPNNESDKTMGHYCSMNEHDSLYITPIDKRSRSTFMLTTPTSPVKHQLKPQTENLSTSNKKSEAAVLEDSLTDITDDISVVEHSSERIRLTNEISPCHVNKNLSCDQNNENDINEDDSDIEIVCDNFNKNQKSEYKHSPKFGRSSRSQGSQVLRHYSGVHDMSDSVLDDGDDDRIEKMVDVGGEGMEDVWEGFDDDGFNFYEVQYSANQTTEHDEGREITEQDERREITEQDEEREITSLEVVRVPVIGNTNESRNNNENGRMNCDDMVKINFKTPTMSKSAKKARKKKEWEAPSPFTPMSNYNDMNTPQLKNQIDKFGLRPACKKRMKEVLQKIYHETHQYETDSDCELDEDKVQKTQQATDSKSNANSNIVKAGKKIVKAVSTKNSKSVVKNLTHKNKVVNITVDGSSDDQFSSSQSSDISDLPEESFIAVDEEENSTQSNKCSKGELFKKLTDFIQTNPDIHKQILMYIPLEIDVFKKKIGESGLKCSMGKLLEFLDEKCINFTMKNNRKPRKQKKRPKSRKVIPTVDV